MKDLLQYTGYLFDLDGVLWRGKEAVPGAPDTVKKLKQLGKRVLFVTNNAGTTRKTQHQKLLNMGFPAAIEEVVTSGYATARHLMERFGPSQIFVMGTEELATEMKECGHTVVSDNAGFVVVGYDPEFSYAKLDAAFQTLRKDGGMFVACNTNPILPTEDGFHPGVGPSVQALATCLGRGPDLIVGKPHEPIMQISLEALGLPANECVMTGDMVEHDLEWAAAFDMDTVFVLSGVQDETELARRGFKPTFIKGSVADFFHG